jgi:hypothetical protein
MPKCAARRYTAPAIVPASFASFAAGSPAVTAFTKTFLHTVKFWKATVPLTFRAW